MQPTILKTRDGHLDRADTATFDAFKTRLQASSAPLLIHIHGGLVNEELGVGVARRLSGPFGYLAPEDYEQLYIVWRSGLLETLKTNWRELHRRDRLYRSLLGKLLQFIGRKLGIRLGETAGGAESFEIDRAEIERRLASLGNSPFDDFDRAMANEAAGIEGLSEDRFAAELQRELEADSELIAVAQDISAAFAPRAESLSFSGNSDQGREILSRLDPDIGGQLRKEYMTPQGAEGFGFSVLGKLVYYGVKIGRRVWRRIRSGRDHGVHATVIEEILRELYGDHIGSAIWSLMKTDTADHFSGRFGTQLLDIIEGTSERKIVLVGHSAGAILVCNLLKAWAKRATGRKVDVVFLAPAVRDRLFAETLTQAEASIDRFRIFCLNDHRERNDALFGDRLGFLYPSSLLYVVSGLFEDDDQKPHVDAPLLGMERFRRWSGGSLGNIEDQAARQIKHFLQSKDNAEVFAPSNAGPGQSSDARTHGGIDNDQATLASARTFF